MSRTRRWQSRRHRGNKRGWLSRPKRGSIRAGSRWYASRRLATIYVGDAEVAASTLRLRRADSGANVLLLQPFNDIVFARSTDHAGVTYAAPSQVAADLLTGPGRGPAEGEELLRWMEHHEHDWRT